VGEGIPEVGLKHKFDALVRLLPYIVWWRGESLRVRFHTEAGVRSVLHSDEIGNLLRTGVFDKLESSQIMALLAEGRGRWKRSPTRSVDFFGSVETLNVSAMQASCDTTRNRIGSQSRRLDGAR